MVLGWLERRRVCENMRERGRDRIRENEEGGRSMRMGEARWYSVGILVIHVLAILIFTKGFLLTRTELPFFSRCSDISHSPCFSPSNSDPPCWTKPAVDRILIIVLDALRFDFVAPSGFFPEKKPWMDKLTALQEAAFSGEYSAKIFKAIADPPTTSLQRLKGLTTGGLPTFIDVGNSFGAPAIVEDNFIHQLVQNGKRVVMMGDDTWVQLFPHHFNKSFPYPSFNVKDLHTVDNGCIDHLFPSLHQDDWDVLIAHFLGVDHAGHIFGVDSVPMMEKLEQYNLMLEKVIKVLESESRPGGLHQNTLLLVMGDHGQTLNGDHGGGSHEEVETSIFAMSFNWPPSSVPSEFDTSSCQLSPDGRKKCFSSLQQLDFAVTVSALLGIPFPFGSIGLVNPELYALAAGTWNLDGDSFVDHKNRTKLEEWVESYANVLCVNSWQVKRYIDVYSASSIIGFSSEDLLHLSDLYVRAEESWSHAKALMSCGNDSCDSLLPALTKQIDASFNFLTDVVELGRSKWTEFNMKLMGIGFGIMILSLFLIVLAIERRHKLLVVFLPSGVSGASFDSVLAILIVAIRACSFLSNSYILEEGKVASFLLATTGIVKLRYSVMRNKMLLEASVFLLVNSVLRFAIEVGLSKQAATSLFLSGSPSWMLGITPGQPLWAYVMQIGPVLALLLLAWWLYRSISHHSCWGTWEYVILGTILSYMLIAVHWMSESGIPNIVVLLQGIQRSYIPRMIYVIGFGQLLLVASHKLFGKEKTLTCRSSFLMKMLAILSAWSSTVIILSGKQGSWVALVSVIGGYCITRLGSIKEDVIDGTGGDWTFDPLAVTQWNLLAVCLFFATGHWCAFDGLRYGAAFIGFDEFILVRQAILLAIDTFGFSHILPIFGLPLLAVHQKFLDQTDRGKSSLFARISLIYLTYGLIVGTAVTVTVICVTIQRRHLMVWGLFAPKFVFDVVGLLLSDVLICVASLLYFSQPSRRR